MPLLYLGASSEPRNGAECAPPVKDWLGFLAVGAQGVAEWVRYEFPPLRASGVDHHGNPLRVPGAAVLRARRLRVESADGRAVEAHLNGDAVATTPLSVEPWGKVKLLAPDGAGAAPT